jgi:hypothetical protein
MPELPHCRSFGRSPLALAATGIADERDFGVIAGAIQA